RGRRLLFMAGIALFSGASLICGLSQSDGMLLVARGAQGLGGAMVSPAALSIILTSFAEGPERNRALAVWGAIAGAGGAIGLLLGGVMVEGLTWRWVFFINVPIGSMLLLSAGLFGMFFFCTLYLQQVLGYNALKTGLVYMPFSVMLIGGSGVASRLVDRFTPKPVLVIGLLLSTAGFVLLTRVSGH